VLLAAVVQPFTPQAMPETSRAADRAAIAEQLRQVSAGSVSSASLPINGVHRVLKVRDPCRMSPAFP
jgi:hypothetical protein